MTGMIQVDTRDGSGRFDAYCAEQEGTPRAAIVVIQEIFGVNAGIRASAIGWPRRDTSRSRPICSGGSRQVSSSIPTSPGRCRRRLG